MLSMESKSVLNIFQEERKIDKAKKATELEKEKL